MKALFHLVRVAEGNKGFPEIEVLFNYSGQFTDCEWALSQDDLPPESFQHLSWVPSNGI